MLTFQVICPTYTWVSFIFNILGCVCLNFKTKKSSIYVIANKLLRFKKKLISKMNKNGLKKPQNVFKNKYMASIAFINHLMTTHGEMQWSIEVK